MALCQSKKKMPSNKKNYKHNDILFDALFPGNNNKAPGTPDTAIGEEEMVGHTTRWKSKP